MSGIKQWVVKEPWLDLHCELGEGPYYEATTNTLRFVDIKKKQLHTVNLTQGPKSLKTLQLDMPIGVTADIEGIDPQEKILVAGKSGIYILERKSGKYELLKKFYDTEEKDERLRSNDGAVDPQGRFWVGTMSDFWVGEFHPEGKPAPIPPSMSTQCFKSLNRSPSWYCSVLQVEQAQESDLECLQKQQACNCLYIT